MGLRFTSNGKVIDSGESPIQEVADASAQSADGRSLLDSTSATYYVDGSVDKLTDRAFNAAIRLPPTGNYTRVMPVKTDK